MKYSGSCLCGKVRYEVVKFEEKIGHCHCTMCRKFHGAAFSTFGSVLLENCVWVSGESNLKNYTASNGSVRQFCCVCGSSMVFCAQGDKGVSIELALSTLDCDIEVAPDAHIYTSYKANWLSLSDELPKYKEYRDGEWTE